MEENPQNLAIYTQNLTKKFDNFTAVNDVSLKIPQGKIYALIGPNGAGKTTLIKMLVGLIRPTNGKAFIKGFNITNDPLKAKGQFGYVSDNPAAYDFLTGLEFLAFSGNLKNIEKTELNKRINQLSSLFPITDILNTQMTSYSRGNRQKIAYAASLLSNPPVLVIDEPVAGLDPISIKILGKSLRDFSLKGGTVLLVSHILSFAENYADIVGLMNKGKIILEEKISKGISLEKIYEKAI